MISRGGRPSRVQPLDPRGTIEFVPFSPDAPAPRTPLSSGPQTITRIPATVNLQVWRGDDVGFSVAVFDEDGEPADLAGATVRAQIRVGADAAQIEGVFDTEIEDNIIRLRLRAETSEGLPRALVWDCEMVLDDWVTTLTAGTIAVTPDVTR